MNWQDETKWSQTAWFENILNIPGTGDNFLFKLTMLYKYITFAFSKMKKKNVGTAAIVQRRKRRDAPEIRDIQKSNRSIRSKMADWHNRRASVAARCSDEKKSGAGTCALSWTWDAGVAKMEGSRGMNWERMPKSGSIYLSQDLIVVPYKLNKHNSLFMCQYLLSKNLISSINRP